MEGLNMKYCIKLVNGKLVEISKEDYELYLSILELGYINYVDYDDELGSVKVIEKVHSND